MFIFLGEFSELYEAVYHSAVNFSSLGYGDVVMSARWKLLGPLEAANGVLMFGMTSAALMAILQQLIKVQFEAGRQRKPRRLIRPRMIAARTKVLAISTMFRTPRSNTVCRARIA